MLSAASMPSSRLRLQPIEFLRTCLSTFAPSLFFIIVYCSMHEFHNETISDLLYVNGVIQWDSVPFLNSRIIFVI